MLSFLRSLLGRSAVEREFDDEIRDHIDRDIADRMRRGVSAREARRQAIADLGGVDSVREQLRDQHGTSRVTRASPPAGSPGTRVMQSSSF